MKRKFKILRWVAGPLGWLGVTLLALVPACVLGENAPRLSLEQARQMAFQRNWDILAANSEVDAAAAQKIVAREFPNPSLTLSTTKISVDGSVAHTSAGNGWWQRNYDSVAAINQLFEIGGKRASRKQSSEAGQRGAEARLADARRLLDQAVTKAYVGVLLAQATVSNLQHSAASLRKEAGIAEVRFKAGDISAADKSQIEMAADRLELDAEAAKASAVTARLTVNNLMGAARAEADWVPADSLDSLTAQPEPRVAENVVRRPDWVAAEAAVRKAEADLRLQKAMRIPDPTVLFQVEHEPPDQPGTVGIGVSFPLPLWNRNRGNIRAAEAAREQAKVQLAKLEAQLALEVAVSRTAFETATVRARRYHTEIEPRSAEILNTVSFAYQKGGATLLDLLAAERNDNDIRLATTQATADAALAAADLRAASQSIQDH